MDIFALIVAGVFFLFFFFGFLVFGRPRFLSQFEAKKTTALSIVIPARNEESRLPLLLASLRNQLKEGDEVIVVDDESSDSTAKIALSYAAKVISVDGTRPPGWGGKTWSLHLGAEKTKNERMLFLDADLVAHDGFLETCRSVDLKERVLSICPTHATLRFFESFSCFFNLLSVMGTENFALKENPKGLLFGPSLLIEKTQWQRVGGYESVKDKVLENFNLTKVLNREGLETRSVLGGDLLEYRMYESFPDLIRGWSKAFTTASAEIDRAFFLKIVLWTVGVMGTAFYLPLSFFFENELIGRIGIALYLLYVFQLWLFFARVGRFSLACSVFFPVYFVFYNVLFFQAKRALSRGKAGEWKGRKV